VSPRDAGFGRRIALAAVLSLVPVPAWADVTKQECIEANGKAQELRRGGQLSAARDQLRACAVPACPSLVRDDCARRLDDLERVQPTIVFDTKDGVGNDLASVKVTVDGRPLADNLDGKPLMVDPGSHVFVFTVAGQPPLTQTFVIKEGDQLRRERVVIGPAAPVVAPARSARAVPSSSMPPPASPGAGHPAGGHGGQKVLGLVTGGVGLAGVVVGTVFGLLTLSEVSKQKADCESQANCPHPDGAASDHSSAMTDRLVSTVGFIAGGTLVLGGSALFFFSGRPRSESPPAGGIIALPSVVPGGAGVSCSGTF
jgi:hypothetical protein